MSKPAFYRKRPLIVEAMQWDGSASSAASLVMWGVAGGSITPYGHGSFPGEMKVSKLLIRTLEGPSLNLVPGGWLIKGIKGEFYPCADDVFRASYVAVDAAAAVPAVAAFTLDNVEMRHLANPERFPLDSREDRCGLQHGDYAKLVFLPNVAPSEGPTGERMWVRVAKRIGDGEEVRYLGTLENVPEIVSGQLGDVVLFHPHHIADLSDAAPTKDEAARALLLNAVAALNTSEDRTTFVRLLAEKMTLDEVDAFLEDMDGLAEVAASTDESDDPDFHAGAALFAIDNGVTLRAILLEVRERLTRPDVSQN